MISKGNEIKRLSFLLVVIGFNLDIGDMISGTMPYSHRRFMLHKLIWRQMQLPRAGFSSQSNYPSWKHITHYQERIHKCLHEQFHAQAQCILPIDFACHDLSSLSGPDNCLIIYPT